MYGTEAALRQLKDNLKQTKFSFAFYFTYTLQCSASVGAVLLDIFFREPQYFCQPFSLSWLFTVKNSYISTETWSLCATYASRSIHLNLLNGFTKKNIFVITWAIHDLIQWILITQILMETNFSKPRKNFNLRFRRKSKKLLYNDIWFSCWIKKLFWPLEVVYLQRVMLAVIAFPQLSTKFSLESFLGL